MANLLNADTLTRAIVSGGVFTGIAWFMSGGNAGINTYAMAAAVQGVAVAGSDAIHNLISMSPSSVSSAVVTGGLYTAAQFYGNGERNYANNFGVSAGAEFVARNGWDMWLAKSEGGHLTVDE
jgi:hypothetical protein